MKIVTSAEKPKATYQEYDVRYPMVFEEISRRFSELDAPFVIEHVGSTAVPGCGGKGILDIVAIYEDEKLEQSTEFLTQHGFSKQGEEFVRPWPDSRPMLLGNYEFQESRYLVYVHVLHFESDEIRRFRVFRDRLAGNKELISEYNEVKSRIISEGIFDTDHYAFRKRGSIHEILGEDYALKKT